MKVIRLFLMILSLVVTGVAYSAAGNSNVTKISSTTQNEAKPEANIDYDDKYLGYKMDGVTSASKLAAQRSHTVAGKDERNFAIFTAITAIFIIYFFSQFEFFDK